jgi:hypothetical protein
LQSFEPRLTTCRASTPPKKNTHKYSGHERHQLQKRYVLIAEDTASDTCKTRTYMRPPRRAQPTRRLPRVRREHGLVAHPAPTHTHSPLRQCLWHPPPTLLSRLSLPSNLPLRPMPQTAARVSLERDSNPRPRGGATQHATHAETQIPAGRRRRGTKAVLSAGCYAKERRGGRTGTQSRCRGQKGRGAHLVTRPAMRLAALRSFDQSWVPMGFIGS